MRGEEIGLHNIFRAMPNPTEGLDADRTAAITGSVQAMGLSFSNNDNLMKVQYVCTAVCGGNSGISVQAMELAVFQPTAWSASGWYSSSGAPHLFRAMLAHTLGLCFLGR